MRRIKIGDVFYIKVSNGYKLFQWAYDIPKKGQFIRVFPGLYDSIPDNIEDLVSEEHSYIIAARIRHLHRIGLATHLAHYAVPEEYPFPPYDLEPCIDQRGEVYRILFLKTKPNGPAAQFGIAASSMEELPDEYKNIKLLNGYVTPAVLLYLFDYDFDLNNLARFRPRYVLGEKCREKLEEYLQIVETAEAKTKK